MAKTDFDCVDAYIAAQPEAARPVLERVRTIIRQTAPAVEELISYQIPAFRLDGEYVTYLAGFKRHYSLYPVSARLLEALGDELAPYLAGKGTMRFALADPVPEELIGRIVEVRAAEAVERANERATVKRRRPART